MDDVRIAIGLDPETDQVDILYDDDARLDPFEPGESYYEVFVPPVLVDDLRRAESAWLRAVSAIVENVGFDRGLGNLPLCDEYDGQAHEWGGRKSWDDCWRCGHDRDEHAASGSTVEQDQ